MGLLRSILSMGILAAMTKKTFSAQPKPSLKPLYVMISVKRKALQLSSGKKIRLSGNAFCISPNLEIGEGFMGNIFGYNPYGSPDIKVPANPWLLSKDDLLEISDGNISLWMQLKDRIRQHGIDSLNVFRSENKRNKEYQLSSGKKIRTAGIAFCVNLSLEVGEGFTTNIFGVSLHFGSGVEKPANPWSLAKDDLIELSDYNITLWMALKDRIRQQGIESTDVFRKSP